MMRTSRLTSFGLGALAGAVLALGGVTVIHAARGPSTPAAPYVVKSAHDLSALDRALRGVNRSANFVVDAPVPYTATLQHEEDFALGAAEVHDGKDHVIYIVEGKTVFHIGGSLEGAREISPGEWRGPRLAGHKVIEAKTGDLVILPRGTPHFRTTKGSTVSMLMVQIFSTNQGPAATSRK